MKLSVIAECVDTRSGKRFYPGDTFSPAPEETQLDRLVRAGCVRVGGTSTDPAAIARDQINGDHLFQRKVAELKDIAKAEKIDLGDATKREDIITTIRQARATRPSDGLDSLDVVHLRVLASAAGATFDDKTDPTTLAALIRSRPAPADAQPDYERDNLSEKPLADLDRNGLLVVAAYEKADVSPEADDAALIAAIEAKRSPNA